jgi:hypothetical protein
MLFITRGALAAGLLFAVVAAGATLSTGSSEGVARTFSGTVARETVTAHNFTLPRDGTITVTLTGLGPKSSTHVGLGLGTPTAAGNCALVEAADATRVSDRVGGTLSKGTYCVAVYDSGDAATQPLDYTVDVTEE